MYFVDELDIEWLSLQIPIECSCLGGDAILVKKSC